MKLFSEISETETLSALFGLVFVILGWLFFTLAISSAFFFPLATLGTICAFGAAIYIGGKLVFQTKWDFKIALLLALVAALLAGYFSSPGFFSGRDQGSIAEAAFRLAQNGRLAFSTPASRSFAEIYGEGTALNFPGFAYTEKGDLITQFPLGYTAWLAGFISLFGLYGPAAANAALLFLFLFSFYNLLKLFAHPYYAFAGTALATFSFLPTWFAKFTLSENLALFLFTFLAWSILLFLQTNRYLFYLSALTTAGLLAFTRFEGLFFLALTLIVLFFNQPARNLWKSSPLKNLLLPALVFLLFLGRNVFINLPYYKMIGKALLKFLNQFGGSNIPGLAETGGSVTLGAIFFLYGLLIVFALGFLGVLVFLKEKRYILLLPIFLSLPTFLYFFDPNISLNHPWMLRRYLFSLFPALLFSAVLGIALLFDKEKNLPLPKPRGKRFLCVNLIFLGMFVLQYPAWRAGLFFTENPSLLKQVSDFSQKFGDKDLILVDRNATGDGFTMLTGPAQVFYPKNAVYFFNPYDLAKLDLSPFAQVYLLVPEGDQARYISVFGNRLVFRETIPFSLEQFENLSLDNVSPLRLPQKTNKETKNLLLQIY